MSFCIFCICGISDSWQEKIATKTRKHRIPLKKINALCVFLSAAGMAAIIYIPKLYIVVNQFIKYSFLR